MTKKEDYSLIRIVDAKALSIIRCKSVRDFSSVNNLEQFSPEIYGLGVRKPISDGFPDEFFGANNE